MYIFIIKYFYFNTIARQNGNKSFYPLINSCCLLYNRTRNKYDKSIKKDNGIYTGHINQAKVLWEIFSGFILQYSHRTKWWRKKKWREKKKTFIITFPTNIGNKKNFINVELIISCHVSFHASWTDESTFYPVNEIENVRHGCHLQFFENCRK